jgi:hypothetical protein
MIQVETESMCYNCGKVVDITLHFVQGGIVPIVVPTKWRETPIGVICPECDSKVECPQCGVKKAEIVCPECDK